MHERPAPRRPSFDWPPSRDELDRFDVLDVAGDRAALAGLLRGPTAAPGPPPLGTEAGVARQAAPPGSAPTPPAGAVRDAESTTGPRAALAYPGARGDMQWRLRAVRVPLSLDRLVLLASGVLLGAALPGLGEWRAVPASTGAPAFVTAATVAPATGALGQVPGALGATSADTSTAPAVVRGRAPALPHQVSVDATLGATPSPVLRTVRTRTVVDPRTREVLSTVRAYEAAWTRMDSRAASALWPSADPAALRRGFTALREQRLQLADCRVTVAGSQASATCRGTLRYRPRLGDHSTRVRRGRWTFDLGRGPRGWRIDRVQVR